MNNPIKLKKGDIGVYITLALFGAGVGLIMGSIISSRMQHNTEEDNFIDEEQTHKELQNVVKETRESGTKTTSKEALPVRETSRRDTEKHRGSGPGTNDEIEEEFERLRKEYIVEEEDEEAVMSGQMSIADLELKLYRNRDERKPLLGYQKPDLDDLVDLDEPEGRFEIRTTDPRKDPDPIFKKIIKLLYLTDSDTLVRVVGNRESPISDIDDTIGEEAIDTVLELITLQGVSPVYVCDQEKNKAYSIEVKHSKE